MKRIVSKKLKTPTHQGSIRESVTYSSTWITDMIATLPFKRECLIKLEKKEGKLGGDT
jgi:hypothetical protein